MGLAFDGLNDYVTISNSTQSNLLATQCQIEGWFKAYLGGGSQRLLCIGSTSDSSLELYLNTGTGALRFERKGGATINTVDGGLRYFSYSSYAQSWIHFCAQIVPTGGTAYSMRLYINGGLAATLSIASLAAFNTSFGTTIGANRNGAAFSAFQSGILSRIRAGTYLYTAAELRQAIRNPASYLSPAYQAALAIDIPLQEVSGTSAPELVTGVPGTLLSFAASGVGSTIEGGGAWMPQSLQSTI